MSLLRFQDVLLSYGDPPLLDHVSFSMEKGERLCLIGRNGTGKSSLFKLVAGEIQADDGRIVFQQGMQVAQLEQEVPRDASGSVFDVIAGGLAEFGQVISRYHQLTHDLADGADVLEELEACQARLDEADAWDLNQRVETVISRMKLDGDADISSLSGGYQRRVMLAKALVNQPDLLLLDEPTNHLDIETIQWLESFLLSWSGSLLFITHDRAFLQALATRIIELDRGQLVDYPGDYQTYLRRKQEALQAEETAQALFDKKLAQEEVWVRQGIKARRTRNEGRVKALKKMRAERAERRQQIGKVKMQLQEAQRSGKLVAEAEAISFAYEGELLINNFSTTLLRGDKVGLIGPNGVGKTTLLRLLLGDIEPSSGRLRLGSQLQVAYFDQYRSALDEEKTVQDNVADGNDQITVNDKSRHVISYLQDFLFTPERARQPVKALSGGEKNRLLLARLFTKPSNVLVLDEPTNDLDAETLELLEELLLDYQGTLLLVSHDRAFLNNVVTSTLVFEGEGVVNEYVGGYDDWIRQRPQVDADKEKLKKKKTITEETSGKKKLTYSEELELKKLPARIQEMEQQQQNAHDQLSDPAFYQKDKEVQMQVQKELAELESQLAALYARWEHLEAIGDSNQV